MVSYKVSSAVHTGLRSRAFLVLMKGCQTGSTKTRCMCWKGTVWEGVAQISFCRHQWTVVQGRPRTFALSLSMVAQLAAPAAGDREEQLPRCCQGCGTEKQFARRERDPSWKSAVYSALLLLHIMWNIWPVIIICYVQYIARISLSSLWSVPADLNVHREGLCPTGL